jgi:sugar/nucleoside kinase (ribokinase family)
MSKVLCIGSVTKDIFFPTRQGIVSDTPEDLLSQRKISFELGAKYHIENMCETLGGCPVNVACGLVKLGISASCYAPVGSDSTAEWAQKVLMYMGVDVGLFKIIPNVLSDLSAIVVDEKTGDRVIFSSHTASEKFDIDKNYIKDAEWIFIGDLSGKWESNLETIVAAAEEKKIPFAFNPRGKSIGENVQKIVWAISLCKILFVNKDEAIEIVSLAKKDNSINEELINDEKYLAEELKDMGAGVVVITDGIRGAGGCDGEKVLHAGALVRKAVDSTGAGDAFASGFFASFLKGNDLGTCLKWGIANSSSSVTEYGGQRGLLAQGDIENVMQDIELKEI